MSADAAVSTKRELEKSDEDVDKESPKKAKYEDNVKESSSSITEVESANGTSTSSTKSNNDTTSSGGIREKDAGITEYISDLPGFSAVLKERYSDFLVYEIDPDGKVVRLTDTEAPDEEEEEPGTKLTNIISDSDMELLRRLSSSEEKCRPVTIDVTTYDKDSRRKVHEAIRQNFSGLDSTTKSTDSSTVISVKKVNSKTRNIRQLWPTSRGNYTHFVLYKENKDTQDAINSIASILRMPPKNFCYAGTKDKRGKTTQMVSVYRVSAKTLLFVNVKSRFMKIGNIQFKNQPLKLGDLTGNKFVIILRRLQGSVEEVEQAMNSVGKTGFINYYGMQRFGTTCVPTHHIGRALLESKWKEAIDLILTPRTGVFIEEPSLAAAREIWHKTNDAHKAYAILVYKGGIEGCLLSGLKSHGPKDFVNALNAIPRNTRLMYVHSYQSYIWNKVVSKRIKKHGMKVLVGDLILTSPVNDEITIEDSENVKHPKLPTSYVTEENFADVTINDVVLPLPGHVVLYPKNETAEWYKEFLEEDGMDFNSFTSKVKTYSLGGSYRKIITKLGDLKWEIIPYADFCKPLVSSDYDELDGVALPPTEKDGPHKALKLEFSLPSACYATMAVREILKMDTSASAQKILNTT